jgi:hypothetical protein
VWGIILIVVGVIFLGERMGWGVAWNMGRLWPLILIALGAVQLYARRYGGALWMFFLGGIFLLHMNHILRLHDAWPLFIVVAGLGMLFGKSRRSCAPPTSEVPHE